MICSNQCKYYYKFVEWQARNSQVKTISRRSIARRNQRREVHDRRISSRKSLVHFLRRRQWLAGRIRSFPHSFRGAESATTPRIGCDVKISRPRRFHVRDQNFLSGGGNVAPRGDRAVVTATMKPDCTDRPRRKVGRRSENGRDRLSRRPFVDGSEAREAGT